MCEYYIHIHHQFPMTDYKSTFGPAMRRQSRSSCTYNIRCCGVDPSVVHILYVHINVFHICPVAGLPPTEKKKLLKNRYR